MIISFLKKNIDIIFNAIVVICLILGILLHAEILLKTTYILAILSIFFTKNAFSIKIFKDTYNRDSHIAAISINRAYGFIFMFLLLWHSIGFEKNIFSQYNLDVSSTIKIMLGVINFSYAVTFSYYKRKL